MFDGAQPNPTVSNVNAGLEALKTAQADLVVSLGGGCLAWTAPRASRLILAANGGKIEDYEGVDKSAKPQLPLLAVNTTAGTAWED